jgi:hypothetical protein
MTGVLFWNVCGNDLSQSVGRIAAIPRRHIRIVVLAEMGKGHRYDAELGRATGKQFIALPIPGCAYLHIFTSLPGGELAVARTEARYAVLRLLRSKKTGGAPGGRASAAEGAGAELG